jgi:hypothetical protein
MADTADSENEGHVSDSSEDIADIISQFQELNPGLTGYANEPQYNSSEIDSGSGSESDSGQSASDGSNADQAIPRGAEARRENNDWCLCNKCDPSLLNGIKEHVCCWELTRNKAQAVLSGMNFNVIIYLCTSHAPLFVRYPLFVFVT